MRNNGYLWARITGKELPFPFNWMFPVGSEGSSPWL